jgi:voltage-gated sodium channel
MNSPALSSDSRLGQARAVLGTWLKTSLVQNVVLAAIALNAVVLGLETSDGLAADWGWLLERTDDLLLGIFIVELVLRFIAFGPRHFREPWTIFDLTVVLVAVLPISDDLSVLRTLRLLRLISVVPSLRLVTEAMMAAVPGMASIVALMGMIFYVAAVMASQMYGAILPEKFGSLPDSLFTMFQLMTLESWTGDIVVPVMKESPMAWLFFIPFILVATFVVLNLFIGVIVDSIQTMKAQRDAKHDVDIDADLAAARVEAHADANQLMAELRALRADVAALRAERSA